MNDRELIERHIAQLRASLVAVPEGKPFPATWLTCTLNLAPKVGDRYCTYLPSAGNWSGGPSNLAQWYVYEPDPHANALADAIERACYGSPPTKEAAYERLDSADGVLHDRNA